MMPTTPINYVTTRRGVRLVQHGTILSEVLRHPGPTHTTADVLAALIHHLAGSGPVGLLGFAGGAVLAPLRALGSSVGLAAVDLSRAGWPVFRRLCAGWAGAVEIEQADAEAWLRRQSRRWSMLIDDLSVTHDGDVIKPSISWTRLPQLIRTRIRPGGVGVFNLLPDLQVPWSESIPSLLAQFPQVHIVYFKNFENRVVIGGTALPSARALRRDLGQSLGKISSRMTSEISVRHATL